jgi:DNA-binding IclR family transcriptional regulator
MVCETTREQAQNRMPDREVLDANAEKSTVNSVIKALNILECFSADSPEHTVAELARRTEINKATCHRLVATMVKAGWLARSSNASYRPTLKIFRIGSPALGGFDLRDQSRDVLRKLASELGDTAYLMVPDATRAVCLDRIEGSNPVRVNMVDVGASLPLNVGAAPLAILAYRQELLAALDGRPLERLTPHTKATMADLMEALAEVRRKGYSYSREDIVSGVAAVGAPIRDAEGRVIGALSLGGFASRFAPPHLDEVVDAVVNAARTVSDRLGYSERSLHRDA